jgi:hypothetical protein
MAASALTGQTESAAARQRVLPATGRVFPKATPFGSAATLFLKTMNHWRLCAIATGAQQVWGCVCLLAARLNDLIRFIAASQRVAENI